MVNLTDSFGDPEIATNIRVTLPENSDQRINDVARDLIATNTMMTLHEIATNTKMALPEIAAGTMTRSPENGDRRTADVARGGDQRNDDVARDSDQHNDDACCPRMSTNTLVTLPEMPWSPKQ